MLVKSKSKFRTKFSIKYKIAIIVTIIVFMSIGVSIDEYFHNKEIGILRNSYIDINRVMKLRKKVGGQIVLCHPGKSSHIREEFIEKMKKMGMDGVEVLSPHHSIGAVMYVQHLARKYNFLETGGSDFHKFEGDNQLLQHSWEYFEINSKYLRGVKKIIGQNK